MGEMWTQEPAPKYNNEASEMYKLYGFTSGRAEFSGWSVMLPLQFEKILASTKFSEMVDERGSITTGAQYLKDKCVSLKNMKALAGKNKDVYLPVFVQVVAKRKVDVLIAIDTMTITMISHIVVADSSGYCTLCVFNEGLETVWNAVTVADFLLISSCSPQIPNKITLHEGLFSDAMCINLELKIQYHSVRNHYIRRFSPLNLSEFIMQDALFAGRCQLKTPKNLERQLAGWNQQLAYIPDKSEAKFDVIGVIAYVGRTERYVRDSYTTSQLLPNGKITSQKVDRYLLYRWIKLIDKTSKLIPVQVYINNATCPSHDSLVPGAIVILSHCQTKESKLGAGRYVRTSFFSQIFTGVVSIARYLMMHPPSFQVAAGDILMRDNYCDIISRKDVQWGIGGTIELQVCSPESLKNSINFNSTWEPLKRRESRRVCCEGTVLRIVEVKDEDNTCVTFLHSRYLDELKKKRNKEYTSIENFLPFNCHTNSSWYSYIRKLPPVNPADLTKKKCVTMVQKVVAGYQEYCKPLLVPCEMEDTGGKLPPMAELEKMEPLPYFFIDVLDENSKMWYTFIWKSSLFSKQEKKRKLEEAKNQTIVCYAEIYCVEVGYPLEVYLHDFVTNKLN